MSKVPYHNIQEETRYSSQKRRAGAKAVRIGAEGMMTFNDDVLVSKYNDNCNSISVCDICNYRHNVIVISLEGGGHIITKPFCKERTAVAKAKPGILSLFWKDC
jgi:hypothetical protein